MEASITMETEVIVAPYFAQIVTHEFLSAAHWIGDETDRRSLPDVQQETEKQEVKCQLIRERTLIQEILCWEEFTFHRLTFPQVDFCIGNHHPREDQEFLFLTAGEGLVRLVRARVKRRGNIAYKLIPIRPLEDGQILLYKCKNPRRQEA